VKLLIFLVVFPIVSFAETLSVALYENHNDYYKYSRAYKLNWELFKLAAESERITLKTEEYLWLRAMHFIETKKLDALIGAYYSDERKKIGNFSQPLSIDNVYLYSKQSKPLTLEELIKQNVLVGVTSKSIGEELAYKVGFKEIYRKSSSNQVFDLLIKDKLQYAIFSESVANKHCMLLAKKGLNNDCITPMLPPLTTNAFHTLYSQTPRVKSLVKRIDSAIETFISNGKVKQLFLESNYSEQEYKNWIKVRNNWLNKDI
jgi:ABC-type amino acid transport substrate-binding protein